MDMGYTGPIQLIDDHTLHTSHIRRSRITVGPSGVDLRHQSAILRLLIGKGLIEAAVKYSIVVVLDSRNVVRIELIDPDDIDVMVGVIGGDVEHWAWGAADVAGLLAGLEEAAGYAAVV